MISLGEYLRTSRISRGLSQRELAKLASVSGAFISKLEANKIASPKTETINSIARALKISVTEINGQLSKDRKRQFVPAKSLKETLREVVGRLPIPIPLFNQIAVPRRVTGYLYIDKESTELEQSHNYFSFVATKDFELYARKRDIIVLDNTVEEFSPDDVVVCYDSDTKEIQIDRYTNMRKSNDNYIQGVVVWVIKRYKKYK